MKCALLVFILCASCTFRKNESATTAKAPSSSVVKEEKTGLDSAKAAEKELQKILHWFEQMDTIYREALWVVRKERPPQGKSMFGKMHRALLIEMKQKLSNKSLFKCDVYTMKRQRGAARGGPQSAEVFHKCSSKEDFVPIGDWNYPKPGEFSVNFQGGNLSDVLGVATGILNPKIHCKLKSNENDILEYFSCENLMVDYNRAKNQVLRFTAFEYKKSTQSLLHIEADVLENLDPVRRIEVDVPMEGKITVTETVLQPPEFLATKIPEGVPGPSPSPVVLPTLAPAQQQPLPLQEFSNEQDPQQDSHDGPQQIEENYPEGHQDGFPPDEGSEPPIQGDQPQLNPQPEIPRERNTR